MTDTSPETPNSAPDQPGVVRRHWLPQLQSRWWTLLLGLSLMLNLLIGGLAIGYRFGGSGPLERMTGASFVQLVPRRFFAELPRDRRGELMKLVRERAKELRDLRDHSKQTALKLAAALDGDTYDVADVRAAVDAFATGSESLAAGGGSVVLDIVSKLTPEERKLLAWTIRDRAEKEGRRKKK